jgi:hypothetical protein
MPITISALHKPQLQYRMLDPKVILALWNGLTAMGDGLTTNSHLTAYFIFHSAAQHPPQNSVKQRATPKYELCAGELVQWARLMKEEVTSVAKYLRCRGFRIFVVPKNIMTYIYSTKESFIFCKRYYSWRSLINSSLMLQEYSHCSVTQIIHSFIYLNVNENSHRLPLIPWLWLANSLLT